MDKIGKVNLSVAFQYPHRVLLLAPDLSNLIIVKTNLALWKRVFLLHMKPEDALCHENSRLEHPVFALAIS